MSAVIGRREFMAVVGAAVAWPTAALAQQRPMAVIGFWVGDRKKYAALLADFLEDVRKGLSELGYVEGKNYRFELPDAGGNYDLMPVMMRELVDQKVSLIITSTTLTQAAF